MTAALLLLAAIAIEVAATSLLGRTQGFSNPGWTIAVLAAYGVSFWLLARVVRTMPVSVAYAVWSGLGTAAVAVIAYAFLGESLGALKLLCLALIIVGVVGLNLLGTNH
jgi:small multidrug resistance pump